MTRWISFDGETFPRLRTQMPQNTAIEIYGRGALEFALASSETTVAVLPSPISGQAGIAIFRPRALMRAEAAPASKKLRTRAAGILGLADETVAESDHEAPRKNWWRRFWDEDDD